MNKTLTLFISALLVFAGASFLIAKTQPQTVKQIIDNIEDVTDGNDRVAAGYVAGHVDIGPVCPVMREDMPCDVPPEVYSSRKVVVYAEN